MPRSSSGRSPYYRNRNRDPYYNIRRNQRIRASEVRVIGPDGGQLGLMSSGDAYQLAQQSGLDLVEVAAQARPPVCRIMDFGKYVYEQQKKSKESKSTGSKVKEVKFRVRIEKHDFLTKLRRAEDFLDKGNKVKLTLFFRGREMAHQDLGYDTIRRAIGDLDHIGTPDNEPRLMGRNIIVMMSPLPVNKRKLKYNVSEPPPPEES
ncbi:MAG: translation initiation factor IF-3 [Verrucomicrobia bacterium]|nr:MAG: translation initiation factor IF-3 [Verrucomicrobiota bacterium]